MQVHSIEITDFSDDNYTLIGVHTSLEDYQLAYLLNKNLHSKFIRADYNLDFKSKKSSSFYSIFEYNCDNQDWFLISNIYKTKSKSVGLFSESETKTFLIPEKKNIDYFLKIEGDFDEESIVSSVEKINQIPQIITSYTIEPKTLKSKEFLIF